VSRKILIFVASLGLCWFGCGQSATAQEPSRESITRLKQAVVIVTTYDGQGKAHLQGTGFFISPDCIVTNAHVIKEASFIRAKLFSGKTVAIKEVFAEDAKSDLALLRTNACDGDAAVLNIDYSPPAEGDAITVISNPQGSHWKISQGQVGTTWQFENSGPRIAITATILPGSSGGPVINRQGLVVGIAVAHAASADDLNFAIPAQSLRALENSAKLATFSSPARQSSNQSY
jgi:serine protease Do